MVRFGHNGKVLRVDLGQRTLSEEEVPEIIYRRYLGGGALSLYYLLRELKPGVDPLGPENILIFAASTATGTPALGFSRYTVAAKSPLTNGLGEAEAGGWWGPELKFSGFDAIIVKGISEKPVYLWVQNGKAELREASHLWGRLAKESQEMIRKELGDEKVRIALIGPGGEKQVRFSCIMNDLKHANGRTGLGAVMGSKNLKAIAVRGNKRMPLYDDGKVHDIVKKILNKRAGTLTESLGEIGSARSVLLLNAAGILPTRNFRRGSFEKAEDISGETMKDTILVGRGSCYGCPVRCKREVRVTEPYAVEPAYGGPEYETIGALGSLCEIGDLKAIAHANQLCGAYTIDTISTGVTIAFAMECFEKGIITTRETGGIRLEFGNVKAMLETVEMIGKREGFGNILAEGVKIAAEKIGKGAERCAMHVKGEPLPIHEPRGKTGVGLAYALAPTGADHTETPHDPVFESEGGLRFVKSLGIIETVPALELGPRKVRLFLYLQQLYNLFDSIGLCNFTAHPWGPISYNDLVDYVNAVTGWETSLWELMKVGERHTHLSRIFNLREGVSAKDDMLPDRFFQPLEKGPLDGKRLDAEEFRKALKTYYQMMGWDENGIPHKEKLEELEIEWAMT
jgi:aldehyde:ferredoxin oxidoreductase